MQRNVFFLLGLGQIAVSLQDLVAAVLGSLVFLAAVWLFRRSRRKRES